MRPATNTQIRARPSPRDNAKSLGFLLQRAHNILRIQLQNVLEGSGIHLGQIAIMGALAKGNPLTQRELCEWTGIEKSSMVLFLDSLEKQGWIRRARHPTDRRAHAVSLTTSGLERLAILGPRLVRTEAQFLSVLSVKDRKNLGMLLTTLVSGRE